MENYDPRRRQSGDDRYRSRPDYEDRGSERESWRESSREHDRPRRAARGWLDYDEDYPQSDDRSRDERRYGRSGESERARFSPDWSREGAEPRYSDEPYYSRNRDRGGSDDDRRQRSHGRQTEDQRGWEQRSRSSIPREQRELAERSRSGDYYSPDWPYERSGRDRGRDIEQSRGEDQDRHYRGYYRRSSTPFSYPGGGGYLWSESLTLHGPYTGRGPKGYKRSDQQIIEEACQRLERDGEIDASDIEVLAIDGVIHLRGTVPDRATKRRAEECVESVYGAGDVMNELRVQREQSQSSQSMFGSQGSQATPASQSGRGSMSSQQGQSSSQQQSSTVQRSGSGTPTSEQTPKH